MNPWFETVAEAQRRARKRLPESVYKALVAGSEHGVTLRDNVDAFSELGLAPHVVGLQNERDLSTTVMGQQSALPVILIVMLVGMVVYAISFLLIRMLSRYRELAADRSGALLTGKPSALASALQKVTGDMARIPTRDLRAAEPLNAFYFAPAFAKRGAMVTLSRLFSTHPSLDRRLEELAKISRQLSQ